MTFYTVFWSLFVLIVTALFPRVVTAQTCPHSACGAPGLPCCDSAVVIQTKSCNYDPDFNECVASFGGTNSYACDNTPGSSCETNQGVSSSNDPCVGPTWNGSSYGCSIGSSRGSCCVGGSVSSTSTPAPTNTPVPPTPVPSCTLDISASYAVAAGNVISVNPVISSSGGSVTQVGFVVGSSAVATVCASGTGPCSVGSGSYTDSAAAFNADLTGMSSGSTTLTVTGTMGVSGATCADSATVSVSAPSSWWQVSGGDIIAGNSSGSGSITSSIPGACVLPTCNPVLIKDNPTSYSGVPSAGGSSIALGSGTYSGNNWRVTNGPFLGTEGYNYTYFKNKIPSGVSPTLLTGPTVAPTSFESGGVEYPVGSGYFWYRYEGAQGNLTVSGGDGSADLASRKVILFVEGANVTLGVKVSVTDGLGGFYLFAGQNIDVAVTVGDAVASSPTPDIEAVLFAEQQVRTGTTGANNDLQLAIRGGVVGLGASGGVVGVNDGVLFQRNVLNDTLYPGDLVTYAPDLVLNWPTSLTRRTLQWREVAP